MHWWWWWWQSKPLLQWSMAHKQQNVNGTCRCSNIIATVVVAPYSVLGVMLGLVVGLVRLARDSSKYDRVEAILPAPFP